MSLHYPALDELSTTKVFKLNLAMIRARYKEANRKIKIDEDEIIHAIGHYWRNHEKARWNGRQIRNACQTALALAEFDAQPPGSKYDLQVRSDAKVHLKIQHLQTVSNAYLEFMVYLKAVHGTDSETYARESGLRALETVVAALKTGENVGSRLSSEGRDGGQRENRLHTFKLKTATQAQQGMPVLSVSEQSYQSSPQSHYNDAPQIQTHPSSTSQGSNLAVPQGGDGRFSSTSSHGHHPPNLRRPSFADPSPRQFHQSLGEPFSITPQHGTYPMSTASPNSAQYSPDSGYPTSGGDPRTSSGPIREQGGSAHWDEPYIVSKLEPRNQPGQNPEMGHADYDRRQPPGRSSYN